MRTRIVRTLHHHLLPQIRTQEVWGCRGQRWGGWASRRLTGGGGGDKVDLRTLLERISTGHVTVDEAIDQIRMLREDFEALNEFAKIDHDREERTGLPEVIYGEGKTPAEIVSILESMHHRSLSDRTSRPRLMLASRVSQAKMQDITRLTLNSRLAQELHYLSKPRMLLLRQAHASDLDVQPLIGTVTVLCAGTADLSVAEEAAVFAELCGAKVHRIYDVGVAGIHRLFRSLRLVREAQVAICVAGMDGALPTVVGGLVKCPVIAVPTSIGYGVGANGIAPLLTMLNACAPGVAVVNIDNGLGGAAMAIKILKTPRSGV